MRSTLEAPPNAPDPMLPGMGLLMVNKDLRREEEIRDEPVAEEAVTPARPRRRGRIRRILTSRSLAWTMTLLVAASATGVASFSVSDARHDRDRLAQELATLRVGSAGSQESLLAAVARNEELRARIAKLQGQVASLQSQKVRTIVETQTVTVTETVTEYVPNGEEVSVEITGFDGLVRIYDVHLTHSYGYSDLIGIAENTSGEAISYAQLGCSFLDKDGHLLATSIDNKQNWQPGTELGVRVQRRRGRDGWHPARRRDELSAAGRRLRLVIPVVLTVVIVAAGSASGVAGVRTDVRLVAVRGALSELGTDIDLVHGVLDGLQGRIRDVETDLGGLRDLVAAADARLASHERALAKSRELATHVVTTGRARADRSCLGRSRTCGRRCRS